MKQIGNLAVVCARRQDVLLQVGSEKVCPCGSRARAEYASRSVGR